MQQQKPLKLNLKQFEEAINLDSVKKFLTDNKDNEDIKAYLVELSAPSVDKVKAFLETDAGRQLTKPIVDHYNTKAIETWKANHLQDLVDEEVKKQNKDKSPEQLEIAKLQKKIEDAEAARTHEALVNKAMKVAKEKNLPDGLIDFFVGSDEEATLANLGTLEDRFNAAVKEQVDAKFKESGRTVSKGLPESGGAGKIDVTKLAAEARIIK